MGLGHVVRIKAWWAWPLGLLFIILTWQRHCSSSSLHSAPLPLSVVCRGSCQVASPYVPYLWDPGNRIHHLLQFSISSLRFSSEYYFCLYFTLCSFFLFNLIAIRRSGESLRGEQILSGFNGVFHDRSPYGFVIRGIKPENEMIDQFSWHRL